LIQNEILISSSKNGLVVDFFGGSGSTVIACEKNNRKCYCFELSEYYSDIIINRWQNYTGKNAILKSTGQTYREVKDAEG
jgi:DNA modification methylase